MIVCCRHFFVRHHAKSCLNSSSPTVNTYTSVKWISCWPNSAYRNVIANSIVLFALILSNAGRNVTTALCGHFSPSPPFRNRFRFNAQSHKSCLEIFNSLSVSDEFRTWRKTHRGSVFKGIAGANIWKFSDWYGWAFDRISLRLRGSQRSGKVHEWENFCAESVYQSIFSELQ